MQSFVNFGVLGQRVGMGGILNFVPSIFGKALEKMGAMRVMRALAHGGHVSDVTGVREGKSEARRTVRDAV